MNRLAFTYLVALALLAPIAFPNKTAAHEIGKQYTHMVGGDECDVRNPATKNAAALRKVDGTIENTSDDLTATISCPIPVTYEAFDVGFLYTDIEIFFLNSHPTDGQKFKCNVSGYIPEGGVGGGIAFLRYLNSSSIDSVGEGSVQFKQGELLDPFVVGNLGSLTRRPTITCGLPPRSTILYVVITSEFDRII